jgi:cytochrome c553
MRYVRLFLFIYIVFASFNVLAENNDFLKTFNTSDAPKNFITAKSLSIPCLGCHGQRKLSIPSLFKLKEGYIYNALVEYKLDQREHYLMQIISKGYSNKELKIISKYYSLQGIYNE